MWTLKSDFSLVHFVEVGKQKGNSSDSTLDSMASFIDLSRRLGSMTPVCRAP